MTGRK